MLFCKKHGLKVPELFITKKRNSFVKIENKIAVVMEYIDGENCFKKNISNKIIAEVGFEVGKMDAFFKKL